MTKGIFSESRGVIDDVFQNAQSTDVEAAQAGANVGAIKESVHPGGVMFMSDCPNCGLQWSSVTKWNEIMNFFLGRQVEGTMATKPGIAMSYGCRKCGRTTPLNIAWDELDRYVKAGVGRGWLPADIYRARDQEMARRAAAQGHR